MARARQQFAFHLYLIGLATALLLSAVVALLLWFALGGAPAPEAVSLVLRGSLGFLVIALLVAVFLVRLLSSRVLRHTGVAATVAGRVAQGDLTMPRWSSDGSEPRDPLSKSVAAMLIKLRELVGTIRQHAHEAAAMAEEIAASTQEMSASTHEVASTTGDLTERANQQALVVRAAAEDAGKILDIAQELAAGATQAAERNAALARLDRKSVV